MTNCKKLTHGTPKLQSIGNSSFGNVIKELQNRFSIWVFGPFDCIM